MSEKEKRMPSEFYSYDTGKPFENCIQCGIDLMESGKTYVVERSIKRYPEMNHSDVIYEYAMCMDCMEKQKEALSAESLENIENYLKQNLRPDRVWQSFPSEEETRLGNCAVHGTSVEEMNEYVYQGAFIGTHLSPGFKPMIFGESAIAEMSELISDKTRDELDGFIDNHFSGPPEWRELIRKSKKVLI